MYYITKFKPGLQIQNFAKLLWSYACLNSKLLYFTVVKC